MTSTSPNLHRLAPVEHEDARPPWLTDASWPFPVHRFEANGSTVVGTDVGTGPPLLFVNVGMWSIIWRDVLTRLARTHRCVTLDVPGSGLSEPAATTSLATAADAIDAVVCELDLTGLTLVVHDLGAPAAIEAAGRWTDRVVGLVVVNGFGWRPSGPSFRTMLAVMGNPVVREIDALTGWLPRASATRFGVGRNWDRATRATYRRGMRRTQRRSFHELMASARSHDYTLIDHTLAELADRPLLTVFGRRNDPLRFQRQWRERFPKAVQVTVPKGYHFPMCDDPDLVAATIERWHHDHGLALVLGDDH